MACSRPVTPSRPAGSRGWLGWSRRDPAYQRMGIYSEKGQMGGMEGKEMEGVSFTFIKDIDSSASLFFLSFFLSSLFSFFLFLSSLFPFSSFLFFVNVDQRIRGGWDDVPVLGKRCSDLPGQRHRAEQHGYRSYGTPRYPACAWRLTKRLGAWQRRPHCALSSYRYHTTGISVGQLPCGTPSSWICGFPFRICVKTTSTRTIHVQYCTTQYP